MSHLLDGFAPRTVTRLTGVSTAQLRAWERQKVVVPEHATIEGRRHPARLYSFRDLVALRTLALVREHGVPLPQLREIGEWLRERDDRALTRGRLLVQDGRAYFDTSADGTAPDLESDEPPFVYDVRSVADDLEQRLARLSERLPEEIGRVERHPDVLHNAWVVAGTRIPTTVVDELTRAGYDTADILAEYPRLTEADVRAALSHEAAQRVLLQAG